MGAILSSALDLALRSAWVWNVTQGKLAEKRVSCSRHPLEQSGRDTIRDPIVILGLSAVIYFSVASLVYVR